MLPSKAEGYAVKAILAHDALVHPDHPLRVAGKPGIELSIGKLCQLHASMTNYDQPTIPFRHSGQWRGASAVLLCASRIHPLLVAHDGPHKRAHSAPLF